MEKCKHIPKNRSGYENTKFRENVGTPPFPPRPVRVLDGSEVFSSCGVCTTVRTLQSTSPFHNGSVPTLETILVACLGYFVVGFASQDMASLTRSRIEEEIKRRISKPPHTRLHPQLSFLMLVCVQTRSGSAGPSPTHSLPCGIGSKPSKWRSLRPSLRPLARR